MALTATQRQLLDNTLAQLGCANINDARDSDGHTPLSLVLNMISGNMTGVADPVAYGKIAFGLLLEGGADVAKAIPAVSNLHAVSLAACFALKEQFALLVEKNPAVLSIGTSQDPTMVPFIMAMNNYANRPTLMHEFIKYFVANGVFDTALGLNVALTAAVNGKLGPYKAVLEAKPEFIKAVNASGLNALALVGVHVKSTPSCADIITYLVNEKLMSVDELSPSGDTALHAAACNSSVLGTQTLLRYGADVNRPFVPKSDTIAPNEGRTAFMLACNGFKNSPSKDVAFVRVAALNANDVKFEPLLKSASGDTTLHYAAMTNNENLMKLIHLKSEQSLVNMKNYELSTNINYGVLLSGATPLNAAAAESGYTLNTMKVLVGMGADVNTTFTKYIKTGDTNYQSSQCTNFTAICQGAFYSTSTQIKASFVEKAEYLLKLDSFTNYDFTDLDGFNSIHWALSLGSAKLLHILLDKMETLCGKEKFKILLDAKDNTQKSAVQWEVETWSKADAYSKQEHADMLTELKAHGASFKDATRSDDLTNILKFATSHHNELVASYALAGLSVDADAGLYD